MRKLSDTFMYNLQFDYLQPLLSFVQSDDTVCLCIRENYINIYYRGANLFKLAEKTVGYSGCFAPQYFQGVPSWLQPTLPSSVIQKDIDISAWIKIFPMLKQSIDFFYGTKSSKEEREYQQQILRDNNFSREAGSTDFFICDIEYSCEVGRFDMIGVHWPSTSSARKQKQNHRLVFIEVKSGDNALSGKSGLQSHMRDMNTFLSTPRALLDLKAEMVSLFKQQHQLKLIQNSHPLHSFSDEPPLYLLALINHDPAKSTLKKECSTLPALLGADLQFIESNFLGYGLFEERLLTLTEFQSRL